MTPDQLSQAFSSLYDDIKQEDQFYVRQPLLAHYTTIDTVNKMLATGEVWFSNPLYMNDLQEVQFGLLEGDRIFRTSSQIRLACSSAERADQLLRCYDNYYRNYIDKHLADTYVFCLSEHERQDNDGILSMWRGYGANGNGAALVFDCSKMTNITNSPLVFAKVHYATSDERIRWLEQLVSKFSEILKSMDCPDNLLHIPAYCFFERLKQFALFTKHKGFDEEREWRIVYLTERDTQKLLHGMLSYLVSIKGIEPKLKLRVRYIDGAISENLTLTHLIDRIILGPSISSPISGLAFKRMLTQLGAPEVAEKVVASTIPFRIR